jgi:hypothetical protein
MAAEMAAGGPGQSRDRLLRAELGSQPRAARVRERLMRD